MRHLVILAAAAIAAAPTIVSAQPAAARAPAAEIRPAAEQAEGGELRGKGFILPLLVVIGIIAALYLLIDDHEVDIPVSP
ncbi:MAG TPA: hypothetical protein VIT45_18440 [Allosphingosinicella sp.]